MVDVRYFIRGKEVTKQEWDDVPYGSMEHYSKYMTTYDLSVAVELANSQDKLDKNVEAVREKHKKRAEAGFKKYGTTTERTDLDFRQWMIHLQEELMDAAVYIERVLNEPITKDKD